MKTRIAVLVALAALIAAMIYIGTRPDSPPRTGVIAAAPTCERQSATGQCVVAVRLSDERIVPAVIDFGLISVAHVGSRVNVSVTDYFLTNEGEAAHWQVTAVKP